MSNIHDQEFLKAVSKKLNSDVEFSYRNICRWYSEKYNTPLYDVIYKLPMSFVLQQYYESIVNDMDYNEVFDLTCDSLPDLIDLKKEQEERFEQSLLKEQKERLEAAEAKKKAEEAVKLKEKAEESQSLNREEDEVRPAQTPKEEPIEELSLMFDDEEPEEL